jgi:hypothetical protein
VESLAALRVADDVPGGRGQLLGVADRLRAGVDRRGAEAVGRDEPRYLEKAGPDPAGVTNELQHRVLGKDGPAPTSQALDRFVDQCSEVRRGLVSLQAPAGRGTSR